MMEDDMITGFTVGIFMAVLLFVVLFLWFSIETSFKEVTIIYAFVACVVAWVLIAGCLIDGTIKIG